MIWMPKWTNFKLKGWCHDASEKIKSCIHRKLSGDATKIEILLAEPPEGVVGGAVCHHRAEERHSPGARGAEDTKFCDNFYW